MSAEISIAGRRIGQCYAPYVICELSGNHNGSLDRVLQMIDAAAATGADAIKIQSYTPDTITIDHDGPEFILPSGPWTGRTLYDLYREAQTPFEWHPAIFARARARQVTLFSTPFDESAADMLDELGAPAFKIASFEAVDLPLIAHVARKRKPMIISTGISNLGEISEAVKVARDNGCAELALLHCVSSYPAPAEDSNVRTVPHLGEAFDIVPGLSDHTMGSCVAIAAVALGACIIEKHFTLARSEGGPDSGFSLEPREFRDLVDDCKQAWRSLGQVNYDLKQSESNLAPFRRSLYVVKDIVAGERLTRDNVRSIRPGYGLSPKRFKDVVGTIARYNLTRGTALADGMFEMAHEAYDVVRTPRSVKDTTE